MFVKNKFIINSLNFYTLASGQKQCLICTYFSPDSDEMTYLPEKAVLSIEDSYWPEAMVRS